MASRYHLTPEGPRPCSVDQTNPRSRGCSYGADGHFGALQDADVAYGEQMGGAVPQAASAPAPLRELTPAEQNVLDEYYGQIYEELIEIPDHSGLSEDDYCSLAQLRESPELLANNCHAVSSELLEQFGVEGYSADVLSVVYEDEKSHHALSLRSEGGEEIILDHTAAQYDQSLPIPFVAERSHWESVIRDRVLRKHGTTIASLALESELFSSAPAQPGPPVPEQFFHIARRADVESIMATGLKPSIGERSESLGEDAPRVYLFDSRTSAEEGLMSWLGDEFDEDEELVLLSVPGGSVETPAATYLQEDAEAESGYGPSTEWTSEKPVPGKALKIEGAI